MYTLYRITLSVSNAYYVVYIVYVRYVCVRCMCCTCTASVTLVFIICSLGHNTKMIKIIAVSQWNNEYQASLVEN